jgi:hypothetical protein
MAKIFSIPNLVRQGYRLGILTLVIAILPGVSIAESTKGKCGPVVTDSINPCQKVKTESRYQLLAQRDYQNVFIFIDQRRLIGCDASGGRFADVTLAPNERIIARGIGENIAAVVTNKQFLAYSALTGRWHIETKRAVEKFLNLQTSADAVAVLTSKRIMIFNGISWNSRTLLGPRR